jgi:hypothetical protein
MNAKTFRTLCVTALITTNCSLWAALIGVTGESYFYGDYTGNVYAGITESGAYGGVSIWDQANYCPFESHVVAWGTNSVDGIVVFEEHYENVYYAYAGFVVDLDWINAEARAEVVNGPGGYAQAW